MIFLFFLVQQRSLLDNAKINIDVEKKEDQKPQLDFMPNLFNIQFSKKADVQEPVKPSCSGSKPNTTHRHIQPVNDYTKRPVIEYILIAALCLLLNFGSYAGIRHFIDLMLFD